MSRDNFEDCSIDLTDDDKAKLQSLAEELLRRVARISKARMVRAERRG